jgi:hypothetical protein
VWVVRPRPRREERPQKSHYVCAFAATNPFFTRQPAEQRFRVLVPCPHFLQIAVVGNAMWLLGGTVEVRSDPCLNARHPSVFHAHMHVRTRRRGLAPAPLACRLWGRGDDQAARA